MRSLFSGNRHSAPLGPPAQSVDSHPPGAGGGRGSSSGSGAGGSASTTSAETLQAVRHRQRERQRHYVMQMMRSEKERDVAQEAGAQDKALAAEADRRHMSDSADALAQQIMIIERIMEEFGLTLDLEEEARADRELLAESREAYEQGVRDADDAAHHVDDELQYADDAAAADYMMHNDVYDEDEAMRDLDELAKQTGRA